MIQVTNINQEIDKVKAEVKDVIKKTVEEFQKTNAELKSSEKRIMEHVEKGIKAKPAGVPDPWHQEAASLGGAQPQPAGAQHQSAGGWGDYAGVGYTGNTTNLGQTTGAPFGVAPRHGGDLGGTAPNVQIHRMFDEKIAVLQEFQYNGVSGGDKWRVKTRNYLVGKCPAILPLFKWMEKLGETPCNPHTAALAIHEYGMMIELDVEQVACALWAFLGTCLSGNALTIFESAEVLNGFDVWRQIHNHISLGSATRRMTLREPAIHPKPAKTEEDIAIAITRWENDLKHYQEAGGDIPNDEDLRMTLLQMLPERLHEALLWRATESRSYAEFREHIRLKAEQIMMLKRRVPVHAAEITRPDEEIDVRNMEDMDDEKLEQMIFMLQKRRMGGMGGRDTRDQRPPRRPEGKVEDMRCVNCGKKGHRTRDCPDPWEADPKKRPCFTCGKKGCIASKCPDRKAPPPRRDGRAQSARALQEVQMDEAFVMEAVNMKKGGFTVVGNSKNFPKPKGATLGDIINVAKNRFADGSKEMDEANNNKFDKFDGDRQHVCIDNSHFCKRNCNSMLGRGGRCDRKQVRIDETRAYNRMYEECMTIDRKNSLELASMVVKNAKDVNEIFKDRALMLKTIHEQKEILEFEQLGVKYRQELENESEDEDETGLIEINMDECMPLEVVEAPLEALSAPLVKGDIEFEEHSVRVSLDSGCGKHVMHPDEAMGYPIRESAAQRNNQHFMAAGGTIIRNQGEIDARFQASDGQNINSCFQMANVTRALYSTSQMSDEGCTIVHNNRFAKVLKGKVRIMAEKEVATFPREGGLYTATLKMLRPKSSPDEDFARQGVRE